MTTAQPVPVRDTNAQTFRVATRPFWITPAEIRFFQQLGHHLLAFYRASNALYVDSAQGRAPSWVSEYLDFGKPPALITQGRRYAAWQMLPGIIRPDLILTDPEEGKEGMIATELDSVPGGIGLTHTLAQQYEGDIIGGQDGMQYGFDKMIRATTPTTPVLAIVISEESKAYRPEMEAFGDALNEGGLTTFVVPPEAVSCSDEGVFLHSGKDKISVIYRFFELFDLTNVPLSDQMLHAVENEQVVMTPPPMAHLEEKMLFALFHHPDLRSFWINKMGDETVSFLVKLFPKTWILDPRDNPQSESARQTLSVGNRPMTDFHTLGRLGQKARRFVIKPSGFSEWAWGSRGVKIGHDMSEEAWSDSLNTALSEFHTTPWVLQPFHKGRRVQMEYRNRQTDAPIPMEGRVRLSPYYFVTGGDDIFLGGILATLCPLNKKLIHGMSEAIMAPCAVGQRDDEII